MMRAGVFTALGFWAVILGIAAAAEPPAWTIRDLNTSSRLVIHGAKSFTTEQIQKALFGDWGVLVAAHPAAPVKPFMELVREKALTGYRLAGFTEAKATTRLDWQTGQVHMTVEEGPRSIAGELHVRGARTLDVKLLRKWLTSEQSSTESKPSWFFLRDGELQTIWMDENWNPVTTQPPLWQEGSPIRVSPDAESQPEKLVQRAFADLGYFFAKFTLKFQANPTSGRTDLGIDIQEEGPQAVASTITITGNQRNFREEILEYLKLPSRVALTRDQCLAIEHRLWRSARFIRQRIVPVPPATPEGAAELKIEVQEYEKAPQLSQSLSQEETILLRCCDWLAEMDKSQFDVVVESDASDWQFLVSPRRGVLMTDTKRTLCACDGQLGYYCPGRCQKMVIGHEQKLYGRVAIDFREPDENGARFNLVFKFNSRPVEFPGSSAASRIIFRLSPAVCLALLHEDNPFCSIVDGELILTSPRQRLRIDVQSGRLLEFGILDAKNDRVEMRVTTAPSALESRLKAVQDGTAGYQNCYDARRPISTTVRFLVEDESAWNGSLGRLREAGNRSCWPDRETARALNKLLGYAVLQPWDRALVAHWESQEGNQEAFTIPGKSEGFRWDMEGLVKNGLLCGLPWAERCFPRDSWPATVWREASMYLLGQGHFFQAEANRIYERSEGGPVCRLLCAALLQRVSPQAADAFARQGLQQLALADFRRDYQPFLDEDYLAGQGVRRIVERVRDLTLKEIHAIARYLLPDRPELVVAFAVELQNADKPTKELLPEVLDQAWNAALREWTATALQKYLIEDTRATVP